MIIAVVVGIFISIVLMEYLWRQGLVRGENSRKLLQITLGSVIAFVPFYLSWGNVQILAVGSFLFSLIMHFSGLFESMYDVKRRSNGDIAGPLAFILLAFIEPNPWIFAAAVLHIAFADGLAAVIGTHYGKSNNYTIFGTQKSIAGSLTFLLVSFLIILGTVSLSGLNFGDTGLLLIGLPIAATITENISSYGLDNLTVLLLVAGLLSALS